VKIFRVDNPHTKPFGFWRWAIEQVQQRSPEVLFLAEAFTRPKVMAQLAKGGFSQSYTYFTWRDTAAELRTYLEELTHGPMRDYFRPNFFVNTPDILPKSLQSGGRAAFKVRLLLAATLSPSYGIYSGFELCESAALPNSEEYQNSEKYEVRVRDWSAPGNLNDLIRQLNRLRRDNAALQNNEPICFFEVDNPNLLAFGRRCGENRLICAINLDPHQAHYGTLTIPEAFFGGPGWSRFAAHDLLDGATYHWGERNYVRLLPDTQPAHLLSLSRL
jgi:starch synthase (maltosyl-transferring)